jgi:hypothetical protein
MGNKAKNSKKKQDNGPVTIYYESRFDYSEIAAIVRDSFIQSIEDGEAVGGLPSSDDIDLENFAHYISQGFVPSAVNEFMKTQFGKGLILGAYLEHMMNSALAEEQEALNEDYV